MTNPFDHQNPVAPPAFMDREEERARLQRLLEGGRNVLLYGARRRGKTSLVLRVFHDLRGRVPIYTDATRMKHPGDLGDRLLAGLCGTGLARKRRFLKWVEDRVKELELEAGIDKTGAYLKVRRATDHRTGLLHSLEFLDRIAMAADARIVVCLDEFQVVMQQDEGLVDAIRSIVQHQKRVNYIFSGSAPSVLARLNHDKKSPFYQQLTEMRVDGIDIHRMLPQARKLLRFPVAPDAVDRIHAATGDNTKRVVQVLRHLHEIGSGGDLEAAEQAIQACIHENATEYERILGLVRPGLQRQLLLALAEDQPEHATSTAFIGKHGLKSGAHVLRATEALQRLEIVDGDHRFLDGLFRRYLMQ